MKKILIICAMFLMQFQIFAAEIIVQYRAEFSESDRAAFASQNGLKAVKPHLKGEVPFSVYEAGSNADETAARLSSMPFIVYAEPNRQRQALYTPVAGGPNDPNYQDGAHQAAYHQVKADSVYAASKISANSAITVVVAVCDTGISATHEDLTGMLVSGINAIDKSTNTDDDGEDGGGFPDGHGTRCAGIIAANTNNTLGIAGASYCTGTARVMLMPVKVLDKYGRGDDANIYYGMTWAADHGADVISLSLGGEGGSTTLQNAVVYAQQKGCVIIAAAGNSGTETKIYPAYFPGCISVASVDDLDNVSVFSSYAKVDVAAPGENIFSTRTGVPSYDAESGTSFAAPFASALAAMIMLANPGISADRTRDLIEHTSDDVMSAGYDKYTGWGRINFERALSGNTSAAETELKAYCWPNPVSPEKDGYVNIVFTLNSKDGVSVTLYDAAGYIVFQKNLSASDVSPGYNTVRWDGKLKNGKYASNGTYFFTVRSGAKVLGKNKLSVLK